MTAPPEAGVIVRVPESSRAVVRNIPYVKTT
jgi:hypothetical protein